VRGFPHPRSRTLEAEGEQKVAEQANVTNPASAHKQVLIVAVLRGTGEERS